MVVVTLAWPMSVAASRAQPDLRRAPGDPGLALRIPRRAGAHPLGQRPRVYGAGGARLARQGGREDALHHARVAVGERVRRIVQRNAARPALERGDLLHAARSEGATRALAPSLHPGAAAQLDRLQTACARGRAAWRTRLRYATPGPPGSATERPGRCARTHIDSGTGFGGRSPSCPDSRCTHRRSTSPRPSA
jgi:hypothetical protein